jgi:hypothetical protein
MWLRAGQLRMTTMRTTRPGEGMTTTMKRAARRTTMMTMTTMRKMKTRTMLWYVW